MNSLVKPDMKTYCLGRLLVDVPGDAKVRASFTYGKRRIELIDPVFNTEAFRKRIDTRETELKAQKHETRETMFVRRVEHPNGSVTLVSWSLPYWEKAYVLDTFFVARGTPDRLFKYVTEPDADRLQREIDRLVNIGRRLRAMANNEVPSESGFCIDRGIVQGADINTESFSAAIWLAGKPDVQLDLSSFVQDSVESSLLERAGGFLPGLLQTIKGIDVLRKRKRPVGSIYGEEILTAGTDKGKRLYAFEWEAPGKTNSLAEPNISFSLGVIESQYRTNAESFASDEEALALWDAIVDSIRLRPGAV